jgi:hypothetical protein
MRSSIACSRCRRSKVKCVNSGIGTTCRACETTGRECTYPVPSGSSGGGARRPGEGSEIRHPGEGVIQNEVSLTQVTWRMLENRDWDFLERLKRAVIEDFDETMFEGHNLE